MIELLLTMGIVFSLGDTSPCSVDSAAIERVRHERIVVSLIMANAEARRLLECDDLQPLQRLRLKIELAKILDRQGLHTNTRPVVEAFDILKEAEQEVMEDDVVGQAQIALALAEYYYRAEMTERVFASAEARARQAQGLFQRLTDPLGEADAIHLRGLVQLQKRNLEKARELFDLSLEVSRRGTERLIFRSDYHRHIALVEIFSGDKAKAIPHLEKSLALREQAGSKDYALYARTTLGSVLTDVGRAHEARRYLEEALKIAAELPSPFGELQAYLYLAKMYEAFEQTSDAIHAYRRAESLAKELGVENMRKQANERLMKVSKEVE